MSTTVYKALDVREYQKIGKVQCVKGYAGHIDVQVPQTLHVVVIAEDMNTHIRTRLDFFPSYSFEFGGKIQYGGYVGDWKILVPGDYFWVSDAAPQAVVILNQTKSE